MLLANASKMSFNASESKEAEDEQDLTNNELQLASNLNFTSMEHAKISLENQSKHPNLLNRKKQRRKKSAKRILKVKNKKQKSKILKPESKLYQPTYISSPTLHPPKLYVPVLRPVGSQVPRAPKNSTQFIMDDHENSSLYVHFNSNEMLKNIEYQGGACDGSSPFQPTDWLIYNVADFESAYQRAEEDKMMNYSIPDIRKSILSLEAKIYVLRQLLEASPSRILARLQGQLLELQEENSSLKQKRLRLEFRNRNRNSSTSSTSDSSRPNSPEMKSDSDSSLNSSPNSPQIHYNPNSSINLSPNSMQIYSPSSPLNSRPDSPPINARSPSKSKSTTSSSEGTDSECSNPDCETCGRLKKSKSEEDEKENTCPSSSS